MRNPAPCRRPPRERQYKIQEVIKRRQILLVQVVKEERGNKGAALTTYLSLAGRYCVLMPNTDRGGGISRRITSPQDRKRLKGIMDELQVPDGMAVILRTAGMERDVAEIKRDYEYLSRLWDSIRELTMRSTAPAMAKVPPLVSASLVLVGNSTTSPVGTRRPAVPDSRARSMMPCPGRMRPPRKWPLASMASTVTAVPTITTTSGREGLPCIWWRMRAYAPMMATHRSAPNRVGWS